MMVGSARRGNHAEGKNKGKEEIRRPRQMELLSLWICRKIMMKREGTWFEMPQ